MLIGELTSCLDDERGAAEAVSNLDDSDLVTKVLLAAAEVELTAGEFVSMTMRHYITHASETEWIDVFGKLSEAQDPGQAFLHHVLSAAVQARHGRVADAESSAARTAIAS